MTITEQIRKYIIDNFLVSNEDFTDDDSFLEQGIVDSTGLLELVMFVEESFGFAVPDEDIVPEHFDSVARLAAYIHQKLAAEVAIEAIPA
ncbi:MAG: acyl carrier protein [Anaerolineae bacterium]|jgi:acyl carrier protein|nr:acyl carrier protein [Anaerolineae bacterium]MDH7473283.1 acyl carrier protein [Anaerolineae bacterium]